MQKPRILMIDNYDSFVHNLARYAALCDSNISIIRNNETNCKDILTQQFDGIILSPGPCTPSDAGICKDLILAAGENIPILGVCLGHQAIGEVFGGKTIKANTPMHGRQSTINLTQQKDSLFNNLPDQFKAGRYHSLISDISTAEDIIPLAYADDCGAVMAMRHKTFPIYGIQFHPESILTPNGLTIICNFVNIVIGSRS